MCDYLDEKKPKGRKLKPGLAGLSEEIFLAHRQLAKSQRTWFKNLGGAQFFLFPEQEAALIKKIMSYYQE